MWNFVGFLLFSPFIFTLVYISFFLTFVVQLLKNLTSKYNKSNAVIRKLTKMYSFESEIQSAQAVLCAVELKPKLKGRCLFYDWF